MTHTILSDLKTCILVSTHDRYEDVARFTVKQIERQWRGHPAIYLCGLSEPRDQKDLMLRRDGADWIGILLDAVELLRENGFQLVYLVLDDHPPMGRCSEDILNNVLPTTIMDLQGANICLFGSGQGREVTGKLVHSAGVSLEQLPNTELWRYSLHPGLWSLNQLNALLIKLDQQLVALDSRNAWTFERFSGTEIASSESGLMSSSYRLTSPVTVASRRDQAVSTAVRNIGRFARSTAGLFGGRRAWHCVSEYFDCINHYYGGPYPIFWRGLLTKGEPNKELMKFVALMGKRKEFEWLFSSNAAKSNG